MKSLVALAAVVGLLTFATGSAHAVSCSVGGVSYQCEYFCTPQNNPCTISGGLAGCDAIGQGGNLDGFCVICGDGTANTITGTDGPDIICGKGGNDVILGDPSNTTGAADLISGDAGNDTINGRVGNDIIYGGTNNDTIHGNDGDDTIYGEAGDDTLNGDNGDDELDGGDGSDHVYGDAGSDVLRGGDGDDQLLDTMGLFQPGQLGGILCGGDGDDLLEILGTGSFCFDGGPGQLGTTWNEDHDCEYLGPPAGATTADFATQRNCVAPAGPPAASAFLSSHRSCNCQD